MTGIAIIVGAALISASILIVGRWEVLTAPARIYRLDRWTGAVLVCNIPDSSGGNVLFNSGSGNIYAECVVK